MSGRGRALCWWAVRGLLAVPVAVVLAANELIAHRLQYNCGYSPSLYLRALFLVDLVIMAWFGALVVSEPLFEELYMIVKVLGDITTLLRDIAWILHIFTPAVTLVMIILYERPSNCDSDFKVPTLHGLYYWTIFAFQCVLSLYLILWSGITEHLPVYSLLRRLQAAHNWRHRVCQLAAGVPLSPQAAAVCRSANLRLYKLWVLPLLMRAYVFVLKYSTAKRIAEQGRRCPLCRKGFEHVDAVVVAPGCRHLFHSECLLTTLPFNNFCAACKTQIDIKDTEDFMLDDQQINLTNPRYLPIQLITHIPVIPPSSEQIAR